MDALHLGGFSILRISEFLNHNHIIAHIAWHMWIMMAAGLLVSIDALFIGVSLGTQKKCKFWYLALINTVLLGLCFLGYALGVWIGESADIELDIVIGILFILLGFWTIVNHFVFERRANKKQELLKTKCETNNDTDDACRFLTAPSSNRLNANTIITGILMSGEAMLITLGLTILFDYPTIVLPLTVGLAHFVYSAVTFLFSKYLRRLPPSAGAIIAGSALIVYGIMAFVL